MRVALRLFLVCLVVVPIAFTGVRLSQAAGHLLSARRHLQAAEEIAQIAASGRWETIDLHAVQGSLRAAHADLNAVKVQTQFLFPLCQYLGWIPYAGGDIRNAPHLVEAALGVLKAGELVTGALAPLAGTVLATPPPREEMLAHSMDLLRNAQPELLAAETQLDLATQARQAIESHELSPYVAALTSQLDAYLPLARLGVGAALVAPQVLGAPGPNSYLILVQNEDELRPTGGFISGVGLVRLQQGTILELSFQDSYAIETKADSDPPPALEKYMGAQIWLLRDTNWSPDFPTAAALAGDIYERDQDIAVDGVIAVDQQALRALVECLGSVQVEGWEHPVTGQNVIAVIRQAWAPNSEAGEKDWWAHRKDFMTSIGAGIVRRLGEASDDISPAQLADTLLRLLEENHVLLYLRDPPASDILANNRWDGAILATEGDYLLVVDTNVGFNKVNPNVDQNLDYQVRISADGGLQSTLTLTYHNGSTRQVSQCVQEARYDPTYEGMMDRCYWDFLRVYVPHGGHLVSGTRNPLPPGSLPRRMTDAAAGTGEPTLQPAEKGKDSIDTFFVVPPQQSKEIQLAYELPGHIRVQGKDRHYSLTLQKQAGTLALPVRVRIELPPSARLISAEPPPNRAQSHVVEYDLRLATTQNLELTFR